MTRFARTIDLATGVETLVPFTPQEEAGADAAKAADDLDQISIVAEKQRRAVIRANARTAALINALTTQNDTGLIAAVAARYPGLTGDGLKAVTDIALVLAYTYRNGG